MFLTSMTVRQLDYMVDMKMLVWVRVTWVSLKVQIHKPSQYLYCSAGTGAKHPYDKMFFSAALAVEGSVVCPSKLHSSNRLALASHCIRIQRISKLPTRLRALHTLNLLIHRPTDSISESRFRFHVVRSQGTRN